MKTVFRTEEIPHLWIHQRANSGRAPSAISFRGREIRSYSTPMAYLHDDNVVLFNSGSYSRTTAKHQSMILRAIHDSFTVIEGDSDSVCNPGAFARALLENAIHSKASADTVRHEHPKRKAVIARHEAECLRNLETAAKVRDCFGLDLACNMEGIEAMQVEREKRMAEQQAQQEKQRRAAERKAKAQLHKWLAGENVETYTLPQGGAFLRVAGTVVETSKGVSIPIAEARLALRFVFSKRAEGWHRNGDTFPIAGYHLDSVGKDGVVAGCHRVAWKELERIQKLLA